MKFVLKLLSYSAACFVVSVLIWSTMDYFWGVKTSGKLKMWIASILSIFFAIGYSMYKFVARDRDRNYGNREDKNQ